MRPENPAKTTPRLFLHPLATATLFLLLGSSIAYGQTVGFDVASASGSESVTSVQIGVTADGFGAFPVTVNYTDDLSSASAGGVDYSVNIETLYFYTNETQYIDITIISDALYENNEIVRLDLYGLNPGPPTGDYDIQTYEYTINDDDPAPFIKFVAASRSGSEGTTSPTNLEVILSTVSGKNASVDFADAGTGTASSGGIDYTLTPGTLTITAGQTSNYVPITIINDNLPEYGETIDLEISNASNATIADPTALTYTINDNDNDPEVQFVSSSSSNSESVTAIAIQIEIPAISGKDVSVNYTVSGTATGSGTDHNLSSGTATITAGNLTEDIDITITDDDLDEANETIVLTLSDPTNATLGTNTTHTYTIVDEDPTPSIDFSTATSNGSEGTTPVSFQLRLLTSGAPSASGRDVTVQYAVTGGTATGSGTDYTLTSGTATITKGNLNTTISASINDDSKDENSETFIITLSSPSNASLGDNVTHTYTITDNDDPPTIQFTDTVSTGSEGTATANIQVRLSTISGLNATVNYAVTGGTASGGGEDYTLEAGMLTISAGGQTNNIVVSIEDDALDEASETIAITLSGPTNASLGAKTTHTRTITDNDSPPTVQFASPTSSGLEGTTNPSFDLVLSAESGLDVTVDYSAAGVTAVGSGEDFSLTAGTATITAGQTTTSIGGTPGIIIDDDLDEFNETFTISLSNPTNSTVGTNGLHTYTITDNDVTPTIGFTSASTSGDESVSPISTTIAIPTESGKNISVDYAISGTALGGGIDYSLSAGTASIAAGETDTTLSITIIDDEVYETGENIRIALRNPTNVTLSDDSVYTYTISNNDAAPTIQFALGTSGGSEGTTPATMQILLSEASAVDASVDYAVTGGTATGGGVDYTLASGTATIDSGQTTTSISAVIVDDLFDEPNETFIVTLTNPQQVTLGVNTTHTRTITDDDDAPTVAFSALGSSGNESVADVDMTVALSAASQLTVTVDYTVTPIDTTLGGGVDYTLADGTLTFDAGSTAVDISATIADDHVVENDESFRVTLSDPVNATLGSLASHTYTILNDDNPPADFTVDTVYATGDIEVAGYWNASNTALSITVPVEDNADLVSGAIQVEARAGSGSYEDLDAAYTIVSGDRGTDKVFSRSAALVEALSNFANDSTITVRAVITDAYGNSTTGTASSSTIKIDQALPAAFRTRSVIQTGGTIKAGYWNATNTGISVVVEIDEEDLSLSGGTVQLQAEADETFEDLGSSASLSQSDVTAGSKTLTISASEVEALAGYSDGDVLTFRSILTDKAGNSTTSSVSDSVLTVDETAPTAVITYSDTLASRGDTVAITMTMNEAASATPGIRIEYTLNTVTASMTATADPAVWTYNAIIPAANNGLATITLTAADLAGNSLTTGNTTGRTELLVDNTAPGYVLSYSDSLVKAGDEVTITATIAESVQPTPTISINFTGTDADVASAPMSMGATDTIWTYIIETPTGNNGYAIVTVTAQDMAGNPATASSGTNALRVDNIPPTIALTMPSDDDYVHTTAVRYTLGETIASGQFTWEWEENEGVTDSESPHVKTLTSAELSVGTHSGLLTNAPSLVQAAEYTIQFMALDFAGNADTVSVATVTYDTLAPAIDNAIVSDGSTSDVDSTTSITSLSAHWSGFAEPTSSIALYEYALGSAPGASNVKSWTSNNTDTLVTVGQLQLTYKSTYYFMIRATDGAGNVSDSVSSDGIKIVDKPRPTLNALQTPVLSNYLQVFVNDTLGMADSIRLVVDSVRVTVTEVDTFVYVGTHKFTRTGSHTLVVTGYSGMGDTVRTDSMTTTLAKMSQPWVATSADKRFMVAGPSGSVSEDRYLLVIGTNLMGGSAIPDGSYRLGDGHSQFRQPVQVIMRPAAGMDDEIKELAIHILNSDGGWEEIPTLGSRESVIAWVNSAGTFRLGPRTTLVPTTTSLHQNYPNPFNPSTRIVFDIGFSDKSSQYVTVVIYNLLGQKVSTLYNGEAQPGRYQLTWQGVNDEGVAVSSGVYFVQLKTDSGFQRTSKMLLIR